MLKILVASVTALLFFSGCVTTQIETKLVPKPFPVCQELEIYQVETKELNNSVRPLDLAYLKARKEEYQKVLESYQKQTQAHNAYCNKIKEKYKEVNNEVK